MNEVDEAPSFKIGWAWQFHNAELDTLDKLRGSPTPTKPKSPSSNKTAHKPYSSCQSCQTSFPNFSTVVCTATPSSKLPIGIL